MTVTGVDDVERRLVARADEPLPESWKPEPGQRIVGRVRRYEKGTTQGWGDAAICVVESLRNPGRLASVWIFHTTLSNAFQKQRPKVGEVILLEYRGKVESQGQGQPYHDWRLVVDRADGAEGLSLDEAFGRIDAPTPATGAHVTDEPPSDWATTGNADDRLPDQPAAAAFIDEDDIPF